MEQAGSFAKSIHAGRWSRAAGILASLICASIFEWHHHSKLENMVSAAFIWTKNSGRRIAAKSNGRLIITSQWWLPPHPCQLANQGRASLTSTSAPHRAPPASTSAPQKRKPKRQGERRSARQQEKRSKTPPETHPILPRHPPARILRMIVLLVRIPLSIRLLVMMTSLVMRRNPEPDTPQKKGLQKRQRG